MRTALFYVSGHGYGHAVRAMQVGRALAGDHGYKVIMKTAAPRRLFPENMTIKPGDVDPGPAQLDCLTTDKENTLRRFSKMVENLERDAEKEMGDVEKHKPSVIVSDISPLGVEAGVMARLPTIVVANFLWDWILRDYAAERPSFGAIADFLTGVYSKATAILRTPLSGGMEGYDNVIDIPLIARRSAKTKAQARKALGLPASGRFALVSFGGMGGDRFFENIEDRITAFELLVPGSGRRSGGPEAPHEDLMAAADVVIGKMGYGLCSELIAARRPLLYTPRDDFIEYKVLASESRKYISVEEVPRKEFFEANLDRRLLNLTAAGHPRGTTPINGARAAARAIEGFARGFL